MTKKLRNTNQKRIIEEIIYSRTEFFNAEEIFKLARKKDSNKADAILIGKYFIDNYKNDSFHG
jgi:hypothetical protein